MKEWFWAEICRPEISTPVALSAKESTSLVPLGDILKEKFVPLSLYSTATQNTWRQGLVLGNDPDARILRWRYQHVGIFWRYLTLKFAFSPMPTPDASQWNIGCVGSQCKILALVMYISCFLCRFHLRLVLNANPISSGIWASDKAYTV